MSAGAGHLKKWVVAVIPCSSSSLPGMLLLTPSCLTQLLAEMLQLLLGEFTQIQAALVPRWVFLPRLALHSRPSVLTADLSFLPQA